MLTYHRITSIEDTYFKPLHELLGTIFPPEEVLAYELWREPLLDASIHVYVAILGDEVVGSTEYRYYPELKVAMTDFTIIGKPSLGVGRFLMRNREKDLQRLAIESGTTPIGMFAEIYDPYRTAEHEFGGVSPMNPFVRREVLSHIGYKKVDLQYVHPSWDHEGQAVSELDLGFLPQDEELTHIDAALIVTFLEGYYSALPNKPVEWLAMIERLKTKDQIELLPL
ncbi:GNAT family N-acetyltransferase [Paenibacillus sp. GSMTC-2017]|uniref:GNAT family N-acetyltransferase n=1 Tax=Paenibacillus sp. GSMTC-2017 TaxID=2794350 RepID=UPI0018D97CEB|nr:GNAT family N-acetyltransferase [Paenibacillus sp. GSMTC-2017]MBH5317756.1 GNAT family N-acetyltransferase [Paenibacillus sp. GSMTC-2017]